MVQVLKKAYTLECNFYDMPCVIDIKTWLGDACPTSGQVVSVSHSHQFVFTFDADSTRAVKTKMETQRFSSSKRVHGPEWVLQYIPTDIPLTLPGRYLFHRCDGTTAAAA
jgi:hypothetical protein